MKDVTTAQEVNFLKRQFLCQVPVRDIEWKDTLNADAEEQKDIVENTTRSDLNLEYPVKISYQKSFLKFLIENFERKQCADDSLYEEYGRLVQLQPNSDSSFKHYLLEQSDHVITLKENVNLISDGTTGLRTWQAALVLCEWIVENCNIFENKSVLELGSGVGLTGLTVLSHCKPRCVYLTDCHSAVLQSLCENVSLNVKRTGKISDKGSEVQDNSLLNERRLLRSVVENCGKKSVTEVLRLPWEEVTADFCQNLGGVDIVVAADVVYDESLFDPLISAVHCLFKNSGVKEFILCCTERNKNTLDTFLTKISGSNFIIKHIEVPFPRHFFWSRDTTVKIFSIFLSRKMTERKGTKGLELWCRKMTDGYPGVNVVNMTTSWKDGLAFCALINHFRPDLIDFSKLQKDDIYHNNELAFRVAERHLGIPALLEPQDMVEVSVPDRLSILTYLSQFYKVFGAGQGKSPGTTPKRTAPSYNEDVPIRSASSSPKESIPVVGKIRREACTKCSLPVFIAERLTVSNKLFHRTCFRCARCNSQLSLANYYETENGLYCCETCPDEEKITSYAHSAVARSLSDEEKTASLKNIGKAEDSSLYHGSILDHSDYGSLDDKSLRLNSPFAEARSFFMHSQVEDDRHKVHGRNGSHLFQDSELSETLPSNKTNSIKSDSSAISSNFKETHTDFNRHNLVVKEDTQTLPNDDTDESEKSISRTSSVKERMKLFERAEPKVSLDGKSSPFSSRIPTLNMSNLELNRNSVDTSDSCQPIKTPVVSTIEVETCTIPQEAEVSTIERETQESHIEPSSLVSDVSENLPEEIHKVDDSIIIQHVQDIVERTEVESLQPAVYETASFEEVEEQISVPSVPEKLELYPEDLNPFDEEDEEMNEEKVQPTKLSLNPFGSDDDDDEEGEKASDMVVPVPTVRKSKLKPSPVARGKTSNVDTSLTSNIPSFQLEVDSANAFDRNAPEAKSTPQRKVIKAHIDLNPFSSDEDESSSVRSDLLGTMQSLPSSLSSSQSSLGNVKKKRPAPKPPANITPTNNTRNTQLTSNTSLGMSPSKLSPKMVKSRRAPLPPSSTPLHSSLESDTRIDFETDKSTKDQLNRNVQIKNVNDVKDDSQSNMLDKSSYGKWKRKKGQAPSRPIPQRRSIKSLPMVTIQKELEIIEIQQQGLEKQGVRLEQMIRDICESPGSNNDHNDALPSEVEYMVLQLFELVNEKNELFRKQAELMYLRRQHRLEEEHADIEYQIRCLMLQPEANKTDSDKAREEELITRLVEIVERRNEIIECLEMDRVREAEEDDSISSQLHLYSLSKQTKPAEQGDVIKEKKKHKKEKTSKAKRDKVDADKDIDESVASASPPVKGKEKRKKFHLF